MTLHITSCLFATVPVHAFYANNHVYHHLFLFVTVTSILFHTTHDPIIKKIDTTAAHFAFLFMLWETHKDWRLAVFPAAVACLWLLQGPLRDLQNDLHAGLHIVSVIGLHFYLWVLYRCFPYTEQQEYKYCGPGIAE